MEEIKSILARLEIVTTGKPWYGESVFEKLDRIKVPEWLHAVIPPINTSIAEYLEHMVVWMIYTREMTLGNKTFRVEVNSEADWPPKHILQEKTVEDYRTQFTNLLTDLQEVLYTKNDEWLTEPIPDRFKYSMGALLEGLIQHQVYHLGQIALLIRIQEQSFLIDADK